MPLVFVLAHINGSSEEIIGTRIIAFLTQLPIGENGLAIPQSLLWLAGCVVGWANVNIAQFVEGETEWSTSVLTIKDEEAIEELLVTFSGQLNKLSYVVVHYF